MHRVGGHYSAYSNEVNKRVKWPQEDWEHRNVKGDFLGRDLCAMISVSDRTNLQLPPTKSQNAWHSWGEVSQE